MGDINYCLNSIDLYLVDSISKYAKACKDNPANAIKALSEYDYSDYESNEAAEAAYQNDYNYWLLLKPDVQSFMNDTTSYVIDVQSWESREPKISYFIGENGSFDSAAYSKALDEWNKKKPDAEKYMTEDELDAYSDALCDWGYEKPQRSDYDYMPEWYASEAEAMAQKEKDIAAYEARMALTYTSTDYYFIDGKYYTDIDKAAEALNKYKQKMEENAAIQASNIESYKKEVYYFNGQLYTDAEAAASAFNEYASKQNELSKSIENYQNDIPTYKFGKYEYDQTDGIDAKQVFAEWCDKQNVIIRINDLNVRENYDEFKNSGKFYVINENYFSEDNETDALAALKEAGLECELKDVLKNVFYWEFSADTYGEDKRFYYITEQSPGDAEEAGNFIGRKVTEWIDSVGEPDSSYVESKGENANACIDDFKSTREDWVINDVHYSNSDDAQNAMNEYHSTLGTKEEGWSSEKKLDNYKEDIYTINGQEFSTEDAATEAFSNYQKANPVDKDYNSEKDVSGYFDGTRYHLVTDDKGEAYYDSEEDANNALADYKKGLKNPNDGDYAYNEFPSAEAAENAYKEDLEDFIKDNPEPVVEDFAKNNEDYNEAKEEWNEEKPEENDYTRDTLEEEAFDTAVEEYVEENPEPEESDYYQDTESEADNYFNEEEAVEEWEDSTPTKEEFSYE